MYVETVVDAADLGFLWQALHRLGVSPAPQAPRFFMPEFMEGIPLEHAGSFSGTSIGVIVTVVGAPTKAFRPGAHLRVRFAAESGALDEASKLMRQFMDRFEEERRLGCLGVEHFLGLPKDFSWHEEVFPKLFLAGFHEELDKALQDWTLVKHGRPRRGSGITKASVLDARGRKVSVHTEVRGYYRRGDSWMVIEIFCPRDSDGQFHVSMAATGVESNWEGDLLAHIQRQLADGHALTARTMTPSGTEIVLDRKYSWDDLYLDAGIKSSLLAEVTSFFTRGETYRKLELPHRRGILLHGPPGCGKTLVGKILASTLEDCVFVWVTAGDIDSANAIEALFRMARCCRRSILFFEDLDLYASQRSYHLQTPILGELLVQLDGLHSNDGMMVVATTNDLDAIEPALKDRPSRFDRVIELGPGSMEVRSDHLSKLLAPYGVSRAMTAKVAQRTEGFTGAQIQELSVRARLRAAAQGTTDLTEDHVLGAIEEARAYRAPKPVGFRMDSD